MKRPVPFKQADVTRAIKGAIAAGMKVARAEIDQTGKIIVFSPSEDALKPTNELDKWLAENARAS
ncbi:hypothetical protein [Ochrobactrum chromiisoli]|uniref:Uncharacterized protein n=1 Tax=Ochrobactrum chromiisoli TaxID=2993941 RepID=A0ABT3QRX5_9HYPH|nr:hypothetical protein [Ochrobactrum chromiisoli]MCX2698356.1 hypothetical protein [Ochrobactrum chromiisoli]